MRFSQPRVAASIVKAAAAAIAAALIVVGGAVAPASAVDTTIYGQVLLGSVSSSVPAGAGEVLVEFTKYPNVHNPSDFVETAADGTYAITGLASGTYRLRYHYVGTGSYSDMGTKGAVPGNPWEETVAPSATTPRNVYLPAKAELGGVVSLGAGAGTRAGAGDVAVYYQQFNEGWGAEVGPVFTNAVGQYSFGIMSAGIFTFRFDYVGAGDFADRTWVEGPAVVAQKRAGYFGAGNNSFSGDAVLAAPIAISGTARLSDSAKLPATSAPGATEVTVAYARHNFESGVDTPIGSTTADAAGLYSIPGLVNLYGYRLTFSAPGYFPVTTEPDGSWLHGYQSFDVSQTIYRQYTVTGHVNLGSVRSAGAGEVEVTLHDTDPPYTAIADVTTVTDSAGNFSFAGLPGKYFTFTLNYVGTDDFLDSIPALPIPQDGTNGVWMPTSSDHSRDFVLPKGNEITGTVFTPAGLPFAGATVFLIEFQPFGDSYSPNAYATTTTASDGTYSFIGLPDSRYGLSFYHAGYAPQAWPGVGHHEPEQLPLSGGQLRAGINMTLQLPATISGRVSGAGATANDAYTHPLSAILLHQEGGTGPWIWASMAYPDGAGNFSFTGLPADTYKVRITYDGPLGLANKLSPALTVVANQTVTFNPEINPTVPLTPGDRVKGTGSTIYLVNYPTGPLIPLGTSATATDFGFSGTPKTVPQAQIDNYEISASTLSNFVFCGWSPILYLAAEGKLWPLDYQLVGDVKISYLSEAACNALPSYSGFYSIQSSPLLTSAAGVVYAIRPDGKKHRVLTNSTIGLRVTPIASRVFTVSDYFLSTLATGTAVLPPGRIVRAPNLAKYFVDGYDRLVPISSYDVTTSMGLPQSFLPVTSTDLLGYQIEPPSAELTNTIVCPNGTFFAGSGTLWQIDQALVDALPQTTLSADACASLPYYSAIFGALFVQSTTSAATYYITQTGEKRQISGRVSMGALSYPNVPVVVRASNSFLNSLPTGPPIVPYLGKMAPAGQASAPTTLLESDASALSVVNRASCYSDYFQALGLGMFAPVTQDVVLNDACRQELGLDLVPVG